jgi:hypothetical protein
MRLPPTTPQPAEARADQGREHWRYESGRWHRWLVFRSEQAGAILGAGGLTPFRAIKSSRDIQFECFGEEVAGVITPGGIPFQ